jgi:hypothetical protein
MHGFLYFIIPLVSRERKMRGKRGVGVPFVRLPKTIGATTINSTYCLTGSNHGASSEEVDSLTCLKYSNDYYPVSAPPSKCGSTYGPPFSEDYAPPYSIMEIVSPYKPNYNKIYMYMHND